MFYVVGFLSALSAGLLGHHLRVRLASLRDGESCLWWYSRVASFEMSAFCDFHIFISNGCD